MEKLIAMEKCTNPLGRVVMTITPKTVVRAAVRGNRFLPGTLHDIAERLSVKHGVSMQRCKTFLTKAFNSGDLKRVVSNEDNPDIVAGYEPRRVWNKRQKAALKEQFKVKKRRRRRKSRPTALAKGRAEAA